MTTRPLIALVFCCASVSATTVYRTVDENGVVSFSDAPPPGDVQSQQLQIDTPQPQDPQAHREQLEALRETTDRMVADRRAREKHRTEMREIEARTQAQQSPPQPVVYEPYDRYVPIYGGGRYPGHRHPPWRPGLHPRPEHPVVRPPLRPRYDPNDQLMRPIVSSRTSGAGSSNAQLMRPVTSGRQGQVNR